MRETSAISCAGNLTPDQPARRRLVAAVPRLASLIAVLIWPQAPAGAGDWHATADIQLAAEAFLKTRAGGSAPDTAFRAGTLDSRHRLPRCGRELEGFLRRGTEIGARTIVGVRCAGPKPWKVYVPVDATVTVPVLIAARTLPKGHFLTSSDVSIAERDVARMTAGFYSDPAELSGLRLKQPVVAGRLITPAVLAREQLIRRGQSVTLTVASGGLSIRMSGKALMDGAKNQRIRVENLSSGRIVEGVVRSAEHVEVLVSTADNFSRATAKGLRPGADNRLSNNDR